MQIAQIILTTFFAWLIHAGLVILYVRAFASASALSFRLLHGVEIFLVMFLAFLFALPKIGPISNLILVLVSLATLAVIDVTVFNLAKNWQNHFDVYHFITAFSAVALALLAANKLQN